jgi:hypothetical protein
VSGPFHVGVLVSDEPARVRLTGPPALLADTIATVEGNMLTIRFRDGASWSWNPGSGVNVVAGSGQVDVVGGAACTGQATGSAQVECR